MLMPQTRNAQTDGQHWRPGIIETLRHWLNDSMPLTYPHSQHNKDETLADFFPRRLECFKHFSNFLFETERVENATTVHIQRRDRPDRNLRPSAAMVGRTGHRGTRPSGASPHLQLGPTGQCGGHMPTPPAGLLPPANAQSNWFPAAGVRHQPCRYGQRVLGVPPSYRRHSSLSANFGATGRGPSEERPAADVRYMPERRSQAGSSGDSGAQEDCGFGTSSAFAADPESVIQWT
jgi:hypothetical protein